MESVKWVKLDTGFFSSPKVRRLRRMPNGDTAALIYLNLLTLAGRQGATGRLMLTESLPFTLDDLACECGCDAEEMSLAMAQFLQLDMVSLGGDGCYSVTGWSEHQAVGGTATAHAERQRRYRERRKAAALLPSPSDATCDAEDVTEGVIESVTRDVTRDVLEKEIEEEKEQEKESEKKKTKRRRFVAPTPDEVRAYAAQKGIAIDADRFCDYYASKGWMVGRSPMRDWHAAARGWAARDRASPPGQQAITEGMFSQYG